jgi:5-methylcytosine-specific restriction enzyme A
MTTENIFFLNGIYEQVLDEILTSQNNKPTESFYIQPYSDRIIAEFKKKSPGIENRWRLYASITRDLSNVHYTAEIIGWEFKPDITAERLQVLNEHIKLYQKGEDCIYLTHNEKVCANLISIRNLQKLETPIPVNRFYKISDGTPLKVRTRSGNWSYVSKMSEEDEIDYILESYLVANFAKKVKESCRLSQEARNLRLEVAAKKPKKIHVVAHSYKRNPDVVAEILYRANGNCELCHQPAPFVRPDGSPYLEVHHWTPLADGGDDTIDNAAALCPNCHKEAHFGSNSSAIRQSHTK